MKARPQTISFAQSLLLVVGILFSLPNAAQTTVNELIYKSRTGKAPIAGLAAQLQKCESKLSSQFKLWNNDLECSIRLVNLLEHLNEVDKIFISSNYAVVAKAWN